MAHSKAIIGYALLVLMLLPSIYAATYCSGDPTQAMVTVFYANGTPANSAEVTIELYNSTVTMMDFIAGGLYVYNYTAPDYVPGASNTYYNYMNSSNPTAYGVDEFTVTNCSITSSSVTVNDSMLGIIILLPLILGFFLLWGANALGEEHQALKVAFFLLVPITFFASFHFATLSVIKYLDFPELQDLIGTTTYWVGAIALILFSYFMIFIFTNATHIAAQRRQERMGYDTR
jgi:hypothetical protein